MPAPIRPKRWSSSIARQPRRRLPPSWHPCWEDQLPTANEAVDASTSTPGPPQLPPSPLQTPRSRSLSNPGLAPDTPPRSRSRSPTEINLDGVPLLSVKREDKKPASVESLETSKEALATEKESLESYKEDLSRELKEIQALIRAQKSTGDGNREKIEKAFTGLAYKISSQAGTGSNVLATTATPAEQITGWILQRRGQPWHHNLIIGLLQREGKERLHYAVDQANDDVVTWLRSRFPDRLFNKRRIKSKGSLKDKDTVKFYISSVMAYLGPQGREMLFGAMESALSVHRSFGDVMQTENGESGANTGRSRAGKRLGRKELAETKQVVTKAEKKKQEEDRWHTMSLDKLLEELLVKWFPQNCICSCKDKMLEDTCVS